MKTEFTEYLQSLGFTDILLPRCNELFRMLSDIADEEILDIFVSEYFEEDGSRYYEDFRVFTKTYCLVGVNFLHEERLAIWKYENRYENINLRSTNYNFKEATALSNLAIHCTRESLQEASLILKSSRENCDHLYYIFKKYLKPHP